MRTSLQNIMEEVSKLTLKVREKGFVWMQRRALDDYKKSVFCKLLNVIYDLEREYNVFWRWRIRNWGERIDFVRCNSFFFYTGHIFMNYHFDRYYFMIIILHHNLKTHFDYSYYFNPFQCRSVKFIQRIGIPYGTSFFADKRLSSFLLYRCRL